MAPFLPAYELCNLLKGPRITILHSSDPASELPAQPLFTAFPKRVAAHFSTYIADSFPAPGQPHVPRLGCNGTNTVTIYGALPPALFRIFNWMLASCAGRGLERIEFLPFAKYVRLLEAAEILGVEYVRADMWRRMSRMAAKQVAIEDVRMVYLNFPKEAPVRQLVIRSIGDAVLERRLRNFGAYKVFKRECVEYEEDVFEYVRGKRREAFEKELREKGKLSAAAKAKAKAGGSGVKGPQGNAVRSQGERSIPTGPGAGVKTTTDADGVTTKTISAVVTRKGQRGRPSYAQVPLRELGISNARFSGRDADKPVTGRRYVKQTGQAG
ncbi:hypothetical protein FQN53_009660 [Emmonsiellopsis sp. PD_33]|nr:hypothetical protein FQN53_009660 [Emmonsiellopsis sp. PD_33]